VKENSIRDRIKEKYTRYINCETDILELTIEEAIFILEKDASVHYVEDLLQEAYKVILSDYKRVLKENKELKKFITEGITIEPNSPYKNYQLDFLRKNFIPVQKVKDKIEYLDKQQKQWLEDRELKASDSEIIFARDVLRELLEGRK
jgi:hypothetical protein